jgi:DNA-binding response OmpR family regulator
MDKIKLLFVEDDAPFAFIIKGCLELNGMYEVVTASDGKEGLSVYHTFHPDVIVSDIEMPVLNGMEMIKQIRQRNETIPILFATGRTNANDVLEGYKLKVDNFIKKPFLPEELDAHIRAILRRVQPIFSSTDKKEAVDLGKFKFNPENQTLQQEGKTSKLSARETEILWRLYEHKNNLVKRENLLEELWGINDFFTSRSLDVFVNALRKHLVDDPSILIETIRGKGLKLAIF